MEIRHGDAVIIMLLCFLLRIALAGQGLLCFQTNFVSFSYSCVEYYWNFYRYCIEYSGVFCNIATFTSLLIGKLGSFPFSTVFSVLRFSLFMSLTNGIVSQVSFSACYHWLGKLLGLYVYFVSCHFADNVYQI